MSICFHDTLQMTLGQITVDSTEPPYYGKKPVAISVRYKQGFVYIL
jgi:hypothetical protein